jgi:hypothetical protein
MAKEHIPAHITAVVLDAYTGADSLRIEQQRPQFLAGSIGCLPALPAAHSIRCGSWSVNPPAVNRHAIAQQSDCVRRSLPRACPGRGCAVNLPGEIRCRVLAAGVDSEKEFCAEPPVLAPGAEADGGGSQERSAQAVPAG